LLWVSLFNLLVFRKSFNRFWRTKRIQELNGEESATGKPPQSKGAKCARTSMRDQFTQASAARPSNINCQNCHYHAIQEAFRYTLQNTSRPDRATC